MAAADHSASFYEVDVRDVIAHTIASVALVTLPMIVILSGNALGYALTVPLWAVQALGFLGLSNAAHECVHGHLLRRRTLDRWAGRAFQVPMLVNWEAHRIYHLGHHAHTREDDDPEGTFDYQDIPTLRSYARLVVRWAVPPNPLQVINQRIALAAFRDRANSDFGRMLVNELVLVAFLAAVVTATVLTDPLAVVNAYWIPAFVVFPVAAFFTAVPEHFGLEHGSSGTGDTRTVLVAPWLSWLMWNFNYHSAHHARPNAPFHRLRELHDCLGDDVVHVVRGYRRFHADLLRTVRGPRARA